MGKKAFYKLLVLLCIFCIAGTSYGQDLHFTQFNTMPLYYNPGQVGKFNGQQRYAGIHRQQWRSVTTPYISFGASADFSKIFKSNYLGGGFSAFRDQAGDSRFTQTKVDAALSYSIPLTVNKRHSLSFGLQAGFEQYSIDFSKLQFDSQYIPDLGYTSGAPSNEKGFNEQILNPTSSTGVLYIFAGRTYVIRAGVGLYNLIPTQYTFASFSNTKKMRTNVHVDAEIMLNDFWSVNPRVLFSSQNTLNETLGGFTLSYTTVETPIAKRGINGGLYYRSQDAMAFLIGYEYNQTSFNLSYDINVSDLNRASGGRGAFEISIVHIVNKERFKPKKFSSCPVFL